MAQAQQIFPYGDKVEFNMAPALLSFAGNGNNFAFGTAAPVVVTFDLDAARPNVVAQIFYSYSAAPAAGSYLKVEDGLGNIVFQEYIAAGGPRTIELSLHLAGTKNTALVVTLSSGGAGIIGTLFVSGYRLT